MRQIVGGFAAFAFAATFVQAPWAHVHADTDDVDQYEHQHHGVSPVHGHELDAAARDATFTVHDPHGDARSIGRVWGVRVSAVVPDLAFGRRTAVLEPPLSSIGPVMDWAPRAHGPPPSAALPPRAPPA